MLPAAAECKVIASFRICVSVCVCVNIENLFKSEKLVLSLLMQLI